MRCTEKASDEKPGASAPPRRQDSCRAQAQEDGGGVPRLQRSSNASEPGFYPRARVSVPLVGSGSWERAWLTGHPPLSLGFILPRPENCTGGQIAGLEARRARRWVGTVTAVAALAFALEQQLDIEEVTHAGRRSVGISLMRSLFAMLVKRLPYATRNERLQDHSEYGPRVPSFRAPQLCLHLPERNEGTSSLLLDI
ncbi:hypothetical protein BC834DRAFT_863972 [Gloeopeniophorella convolvens]|nr:hypothetical protein BC834DRAFT_863972 [Gloeopeniophorella convolvens]